MRKGDRWLPTARHRGQEDSVTIIKDEWRQGQRDRRGKPREKEIRPTSRDLGAAITDRTPFKG